MKMIFELVAMIAGFATVMLALSLLVMYVVRLGHFLTGQRGNGLVSMLGSVNTLYRRDLGDQADEGDQAQANFILDILTHPLMAPQAGHHPLSPRQREGRAAYRKAIQLAEQRKAIRREDLLSVVRLLCEKGEGGTLALPERWFVFVPPQKRNLRDFERFINGVFSTIEQASTTRFRLMSKRWSLLFSALLVVAVNLNSYEVFRAMRQPDLRAALSQSQSALLEQADELGTEDQELWFEDVDESKRWLHEVEGDAIAINTLLNHEALGLGWGGSHITEVFARAPLRAAPLSGNTLLSKHDFAMEILLWLAGLVVSWLLLAQGPAFWADVLRKTTPLPGRKNGSSS